MSTVVKDLGAVSAYAYAVEKGYTGTEAEFAELMADYAEVGQRAEDAADSALESKTAAKTAATTATNKASEATTAATTATNKAAEAQADADAAALDASQAMSAASTATSKATEATTAAATATSAKTDAVAANTAAQSAKTAAQTAQAGAETAAASVQSSAEQIQTNADDISELKEDLTAQYTATRNLANVTWEQMTYNSSGERVATTLTVFATSTPIAVNSSAKYTVSWKDAPVDSGTIYFHFLGNDKKRISYDNCQITARNYTVTIPANASYLAVGHYKSGNDNWENLILNNFQIEAGMIKTDYISPVMIADRLIPTDYITEAVVVYPSQTCCTIAHRGSTVSAPQNTAPSYIIARQSGISIMENDIDYTDDHHYVMWHDGNLNILGDMVDLNGYLVYTDGTEYYYYDADNSALYTYDGTNYVASAVSVSGLTRCNGKNYAVRTGYSYGGSACTALSFAVLRRIDFGAYKGSKFKGTQILTFEEWIALCKRLGCEAYADAKTDYTSDMVTELANIVVNYGMKDKVSWLGMSTANWNTLRSIITGARVGVLNNPTAERVASYSAYNVGRGLFFDGDASSLTAEAVHLGLSAGIDVECFYVGYSASDKDTVFARINELLGYGVCGITLDGFTVEQATHGLIWSI